MIDSWNTYIFLNSNIEVSFLGTSKLTFLIFMNISIINNAV